jgi:hypothetical protein
MIRIFSSKKPEALGLDKKAEILVEIRPFGKSGAAKESGGRAGSKNGREPVLRKADTPDQVYLDISGIGVPELKKTIGRFKKLFAGSFWGIIDPKGEAPDPAQFFFEGASDYLGPGVIKKGLSLKRFACARDTAAEGLSANEKGGKAADGAEMKRKIQKLPAGKFEGWKSVRDGTISPFFFLFMSISGKTNLRSMLGENSSAAVKTRLREVLRQNFREAGALLWMEAESSCLFLVPPRAANCKAAVEAALRLILGCRLIAIERLGLSIPVEFTFALHYGKTVFRSPGKTGAVVSDAVNYIFHLGTKHAEPGRLTVSADVPPEAQPEGLADVFSPAGVYEGIPVRHSRRFTYS